MTEAWTVADLAPGAWVAALATLLGLALRRWWDPVPGRVWAVFGAVLVVMLGPALFAGGVQLPAEMLRGGVPWTRLEPSPGPVNRLQWDQVTEFTPWNATVRRAWAAGEWPLWNRHAEAGMPLLADPQAQALQPLVVAALPPPLPRALGVIEALRLLVALVFSFLFFRRQGAGEGPAVAGALCYGLSGFLILWLGWPHANSAALMPAALWALGISADRGARRDFLLVAAVVFALLLAGHPDTQLYAVGLAAAYAALRLIERRRDRRALGRLAAGWAGAGAIAFAAAAPMLLPARDFLPQTLRHQQAQNRAAWLARFDPWTEWDTPEERRQRLDERQKTMLPIAAPNAYGNNRYEAYWGGQNVNEDAAGFAGTAALLAALVALFPVRRGARLRHERLILATGAVAVAVLLRPPWLFEGLLRLPVVGWSSAGHHRMLLLVAFATAFLAAATWERWRRGALPRWAAPAVAVPLGALIERKVTITLPFLQEDQDQVLYRSVSLR
jgi:hypothetical protein